MATFAFFPSRPFLPSALSILLFLFSSASRGGNMVYVGVSILVASVSFLIYRHPPQSWSTSPLHLINPWARRRPGEKLPQGPTIILECDDDDRRASEPPSSLRTPPDRNPGPPPIPSRQRDDASSFGRTSQTSEYPRTRSALESAPPNVKPGLDIRTAAQHEGSALSSQGTGPPAQRTLTPTSSSTPPKLKPLSAPRTSMLPPPRPSSSLSLRKPPTAPSSGSLALPPTATSKPTKSRPKVILSPGHSPLDWARLQRTPGSNLRGLSHSRLLRVTHAELRRHNRRRDAWSAFGGKVYNITPYLPFHPGGESELMRAAGRDGEKLFMEAHPWVNWDNMLGECLVGILVDDDARDGDPLEEGCEGKWEEMD